jgi:acetoacetate decarboxylase
VTADLDQLSAILAGTRVPSIARTREWLLPGGAREPATWPDAWIASVEVSVRTEVAARWLAPGLSSTGRASLFVAEYARTAFGISYRECGLLLHARHRGREVVSCAWMVVDDDTAMILGRELLGFPKKLAEIAIERTDDGAELRVARRGVTLLSLSMHGATRSVPAPVFARPIVNVWGPPGLPSVLLRLEVPERARETWCVRARLRTRSTIGDPLERLEMDADAIEGAITRTDVGLAPTRARWIPPGIRPVGLLSPAWLAAQLPFRTL